MRLKREKSRQIRRLIEKSRRENFAGIFGTSSRFSSRFGHVGGFLFRCPSEPSLEARKSRDSSVANGKQRVTVDTDLAETKESYPNYPERYFGRVASRDNTVEKFGTAN